MNNASEAIFSLNPVRFRYKKDVDESGTPQFGLVAEDVAKVEPDLVIKDNQGRPFSVRYEQVNAMLLNEFLKEHRQVQTQRDQISALEAREAESQKAIADLRRALQEQHAQIQKFSEARE